MTCPFCRPDGAVRSRYCQTMAALLAASLLAGVAAAQRTGTRITAVRFWSVGEVTRVALETNGEVQYHSERIDSPDRIFFDFTGVRPQQRGVKVVPVGDRLLKQIRIAETQPGTTRVVFDLTTTADYSVSQLTNPDRLIVELRAAAPALPVQPQSAPVETAPATRTAPPAEGRPAPVAQVVPAAEAKPAALPPPGPPPAAAAKRDSRGGRSLIRALGLKLNRVVIDPGHGGHDTGTVGPGGLEEKELVLDVALRLGALITERLGSEVVYTRTEDVFLPLEARTLLANEAKADLFLSIHANSSRSRATAGPETFYLNFTTDAGALEVAARENATSQKSIFELQTLVQKIALKEKIQESREFAETVQKALYTGLARSRGVKDRGVKTAPFVVLVDASMPSVLAEIAFLSNPREEVLLKRPEYRQRVAEALYRGVAEYAETLSHFQVASGAQH